MIRLKFLLLSLVLSVVSFAQDKVFPYPTDTAKDGTIFYRYPVQKSEGWYRISKTFDVKQDTLFKYNPKAEKEGLHLGDTILVPFSKVVKVNKIEDSIDSTQYIVHELQPKETLYGLSRKYKVSQKDILKLNPVTGEQMQIGQRLLIPVNRRNSKYLAEQVVQETVSVSDSLRKQIALVDTVVKEPITIIQDTVQLEVTPVKKDSIAIIPQQDFQPTEIPIRLAILLPLQAEQVKRNEQMDRFVEFYEGILLAVYQLQAQGQKFQIYTYDTGKGTENLSKILEQPELRNVDAIIGPAFPSQVNVVSAYSLQNKILTLVPFTSQVQSISNNPYLLQFSANDLREAEVLSQKLKQVADNVNVVVFDQPKEDVPQSIRTLRRVLSEDSVLMVSTTLHKVLADSLVEVLDSTKENLIIFNTERYANVELMMPKLKQLQPKYRLRLYSRFAWQEEPIAIPQYYTSAFAKEPDTVQLTVYEQMLKRFFKSPITSKNPRFDILGFDITRYLVMLLQRRPAAELSAEIESIVLNGLQSDIQMKKVSDEGGYVNQKITLIEK